MPLCPEPFGNPRGQVHLELLEGPYIGGVDLAACGYSVASFGENAPLAEAALARPWAAESSVRFALAAGGGLVEEPVGSCRCFPPPMPQGLALTVGDRTGSLRVHSIISDIAGLQ